VNKFIHQSTIVYLASIMLVRMLAMPLSLLDYSFNKAFIANNLCENRSKPVMHCGGKCYLGKQLAKSNESQNAPGQKTVVKSVTTDFCEQTDNPSLVFSGIMPDYIVHYILPFTGRPFSGSVFHPPIA
jgi:hypothetical protein